MKIHSLPSRLICIVSLAPKEAQSDAILCNYKLLHLEKEEKMSRRKRDEQKAKSTNEKKMCIRDYNKVRVVLNVQNLSILSLLLSLCSVFAFGVNSFHILRFCADESELTLINKAKQQTAKKIQICFFLLCSFRSLPRAICVNFHHQ